MILLKKSQLIIIVVFVAISCNWFQKKLQLPNGENGSEVASPENTIKETAVEGKITAKYLPSSTTGVVVMRKAFAFSYSEPHEQAEWVAYTLTANDFSRTSFERPFFVEDPKVTTQSADWRNYKKSGYDKGHLCPAGDRKQTYDMFKETFYTSNISPQLHGFNDGVWNRLEEKTRYWSKKYNGLYLVTGGVLTKNLKTIGYEKVAVPKHFYKVMMTLDGKKMIGFLVPHEVSKKPIYEFVVPVNEIETMTGIDFFPQLPDNIEERLEKANDYKAWLR